MKDNYSLRGKKKKKKNRKLVFWITSNVLLVLYVSLTVTNSKTSIYYVLEYFPSLQYFLFYFTQGFSEAELVSRYYSPVIIFHLLNYLISLQNSIENFRRAFCSKDFHSSCYFFWWRIVHSNVYSDYGVCLQEVLLKWFRYVRKNKRKNTKPRKIIFPFSCSYNKIPKRDLSDLHLIFH